MTRDEALWQEERFGGSFIGDKLEWHSLDVTEYGMEGSMVLYELVRPRCSFCASPVPRQESHCVMCGAGPVAGG